MGERLRQVVADYLMKKGPEGKAHLITFTKKSPATIDRWIREGCPTEHDRYQLALACGRSEQEAASLAREQPKRAKRTA